MGAIAGVWLAIGLALTFFTGVAAVVALCRMALRQGAEVEGEIKAPSFRLKFRARPPGVVEADAASRRTSGGPESGVSTTRTDPL
jgi:hypothetical protein